MNRSLISGHGTVQYTAGLGFIGDDEESDEEEEE